MKKWLKRLAIAFVVLLVLFGAFVAWLLESESGARFAITRLKSALADKLLIAQARGALSSPLELDDLHYNDPTSGIDVRIKSVRVEYELSGLFSRSLHVAKLNVDGVDVALTSVKPATPAAPAPSLQSLLTPPLAILLDYARIDRINITQDGKPVFAADSLETSFNWTDKALTVRTLALRAPDGKVDFSGALTSYGNLGGSGKGTFDWKLPQQRLAGNLDLANDGKTATIALRTDQPLVATLDATIIPRDDALPWTATLHVPRFNPHTLTGSESLQSLALDLKGTGDRTHGKLNADIDLNSHKILLDPLQYALAGKTLTIENVHVRSPEAAGTLTAQGKVQLDADPVSADLNIDWQGVELPADLVGQPLATHGKVRAAGSSAQYEAKGELTIGPPDKFADIVLDIAGTPQLITLRQIDLKQAKGGMHATGDVTLQPQIGWKLDAKGDHFNPGAFAKEWPGSVDFALSTTGKLEKDGPAGTFKLDRLAGTLRQRPLNGKADLTFAAPLNVDGTLNVASGTSSIAVRGKGGQQADMNVELAIASLGDWLPNANGGLRGNIALHGTWPKLDVRAKLDGSKILIDSIHTETLALDADVHDLETPNGKLTLNAGKFSAAGYDFDTLDIQAHGDAASHSISVDAKGPQLGASVAVDGALTRTAKDTNWIGSLSSLNLQPKNAAQWKLAHAAPVKYLNGDLSLGELCLGAETQNICASATQTNAGAAQAKFSISHLQIASIARFADPEGPYKLVGEINGDGNIARTADGALNGNAHIDSTAGSIAYPESATQPLVNYKDVDVTANFTPAQSTVNVRGDFGTDGHLDGHIVLGANAPGGIPLSGTLATSLGNLGFIDIVSGQTASTKGKVDTKLVLSGTTTAPSVAGDLTLADFATEIPTAGIKLHEGHIVLHSADGRLFAVDGTIGSGEGKLAINGNVGVDKTAPITLKILGENFEAANIPGAKVHISPDLSLNRADGKITVNGTLTIPKANIDVSKLPGGGAAQTSPDVVVTDAETTSSEANAPIEADITVKLGAGAKLDMDLRQGQEVHLVGFGLNGYLTGQLALQERPGRPPIGRGQIVVDGTYKAYGQDLKIEQGRLLFAGTPVENPGLDLRATRAFTDPDVTVGLQVRGTAQVPVLTVFSDPAMEQSDALSYLVTGKPLSQLKSGEGDAVGSAARALGTAGGDLLAKSIGNKMGLDDVGVSDNTAVGGAALTVGKYLSPRLYISYGVGLFTPGEVVTLRYRLSQHFNAEMQNGSLSSRAGINYKIEK
jgi:translocation and assembly module TamB